MAVLTVSAVGFIMLVSQEAPPTAGESPIADYLRPGANDTSLTRLHYVTAAGPISIENGGVIRLGENLQMAVATSPYPPSTFQMEVDLTLTTLDNQPINDAGVLATWDMSVMWHGPFETQFENRGDGHYVADFDLFMFGPWQLIASFELPGHQAPEPVELSIYVWPG
jgi:hypothetical protein